MLSSLLSLSLQTLVTSSNLNPAYRDIAVSYLVQAQVYYERIERCTLTGPENQRGEIRQQALQARLQRATDDANEIYGHVDPVADAARVTTAGRAPGCRGQEVSTFSRVAARALDETERLMHADAAPRSRGLWIGSLHLCAGRVTAVEVGEPRFFGGRPGVILRFSPDFAPQFLALTTRRIGRTLSVVLDGRVIMSPIVNESMSDAASIAGPEAVPIDRLRAAVVRPC